MRLMKLDQPYYTIPKAAELCGITRATLLRWVKIGKLNSFQTPGGHHRILKEDLEGFMRENRMFHMVSKTQNYNKILIVDDDLQFLRVIEKFLAKDGYKLEKAADGFEAGLKIMQFKPELVILDLKMPNMDGFEVCRAIKKDPETRGIKIIILTGFGDEANKNRCLAVGADLFLSKPVEKNVLIKHVKSLLSPQVI